MGEAGAVGADQDPSCPRGLGQLPERLTQDLDVVGGCVAAGAAGAQDPGEGLVGVIQEAGDSRRARIGAVVLGSLTVVSLVVFWSGAPATLGAAAAWLGGLAKGSHPQTGIARGFGIFGMVIAILIIVATTFGGIASAILN